MNSDINILNSFLPLGGILIEESTLNHIYEIATILEQEKVSSFLGDEKFIDFQSKLGFTKDVSKTVYYDYFEQLKAYCKNFNLKFDNEPISRLVWIFSFSIGLETQKDYITRIKSVIGEKEFRELFKKDNFSESEINKLDLRSAGQKIMYNWLMYFFLSKPRTQDYSKLVFHLREINFDNKYINNLKKLHFSSNFIYRLVDYYDYTMFIGNETTDQDVFLKLIQYDKFKLTDDNFKWVINFDENSSEIQFQTGILIDFNDNNLDKIIWSSDWTTLNRIYYFNVQKINTYKGSKKKVLELIEAGDLADAIQILKKHEKYEKEIIAIAFQLTQYKKDSIFGILSFEEKVLLRNRIVHSLVDLTNTIYENK